MYRVSNFVHQLALALLGGAVVATAWVNLNPAGYYDLIEWRVPGLSDLAMLQGRTVTFRDLVGEGLMALFVFFMAKEVYEAARLNRGALRGNGAGLPVFGAIGGMTLGVLVWLLSVAVLSSPDDMPIRSSWTLPLGGDIALSYLFGRLLFGAGHRALHILLLLTILMDLCALVALTLSGIGTSGFATQWLWLGLTLAAAVFVRVVFGQAVRRAANERSVQRGRHLLPYVVAGLVSWTGVVLAGFPGALGLLPMLPAIPHASQSFGIFAEAEAYLHDPLNRLAHAMARPLIAIMAAFGFVYGGIDTAAFGLPTLLVLGAFWIGKPAGVLLGGLFLTRLAGYHLPPRLRRRDVGLIALLSGIGFTVPALTLNPALPGGAAQEAARMGLALTLLIGPLAIFLGHLVTKRPRV